MGHLSTVRALVLLHSAVATVASWDVNAATSANGADTSLNASTFRNECNGCSDCDGCHDFKGLCNKYKHQDRGECVSHIEHCGCSHTQARNLCCGDPIPPPSPPPPSPPSPPPGPSPPVPPGPLPPVPDQVWFGMWASDSDSNEFSSVAWDIWDDDKIQSEGGPAMRFLYQVGQYFADFDGNTWTWHDDYQTRWNNAVPKLKQMLMDRKILGFMTGDESVDKGLSQDHWETMVSTVRDTFPRGTAIIWTSDNVCDSTHQIASTSGRRRQSSKCIDSVPDELDWISSAKYRSDKSSGFVDSVKGWYQDNIYPKLASHQKVAVIPAVGPASDICDDDCAAQFELEDAKDFMDWAQSDSRVALIAPYLWRFDDGLKDWDAGDDLRDFWGEFGRSTKHPAMNVSKDIWL